LSLGKRVSKVGNSRQFRVFASAMLLLLAIGIMPHVSSATSTTVGSPTFTQTNLVSDIPGLARTTDPNLVNSWGMALGLNSGLWVADNGSGKATTYDANGNPIPSGSPLVVTISAPGGGTSAPPGPSSTKATCL